MSSVGRRLSVYVDESGRGRPDNRDSETQPFFIVGAFITDKADDLTALVDQVCDEENFRRELHWREFNHTSSRVYRRVAERIDREASWEYKATRFKAEEIDFRFFGGESRGSRAVKGKHYAYNFFVKQAVKAALRYSCLAKTATEIEIIIDEKKRTKEDNFLEYLRRSIAEIYPGVNVSVRDCPSEKERLVQVCDIISGAHNTLIVGAAGKAKKDAAEHVWLERCREYHHPLRPYPEVAPISGGDG